VKIMALPPPHHWETVNGQPVEGWAFDDEISGRISPIVYDDIEQELTMVDERVRPKTPARGQFSPDGKHLPDVPPEVRAHLDAREAPHAEPFRYGQ
jgi:hypothetical protein